MGKIITYELSKTQIDQIEEELKKLNLSYFGEGEVRYERSISDKGLLLVNVDDILDFIPSFIWENIKIVMKTDIHKELINRKFNI